MILRFARAERNKCERIEEVLKSVLVPFERVLQNPIDRFAARIEIR